MLKLGFIGAGIVGTALAVKLNRRGYSVVAVSSRSQTSGQSFSRAVDGCQVFNNNQGVADAAELIFITTPDDAIASVVSGIRWQPNQSVVHCSGADSVYVLEPARKVGAYVGAFHPLQTFATVSQAIDNILGSTITLEAEEPLLDVLKNMAIALEAYWVELKAKDKVIYHAAAVIACNYLVTLVKLATDLWQTFGVSTSQATQALLPLLRGTINNIEIMGIPQCLTGPIARGDTGTVKKHINTLQKVAPTIIFTYRDLGLQTITIALAKGKINQAQAKELQTILQPIDRGEEFK
ncbi:Rossmann-like and DUF2520 domain-containing protein [Chloroflexota bacterium]